jgi:lipopolysaccharide biosynthesis regulator YciM
LARKKISRKELLKKPDEFMTFSAKAIAFFKDHSSQFEYLGMIIVGLFLIYLGLNTYLKHVNKKGQEAYNIAYHSVLKNMGKGNLEELNESEALYQKVIEDYGFSKASRLALPELGHIHFVKKEYNEAIEEYQAFLKKLSKNNPYMPLVRMALAACYEEKGELENAIQNLEYITSNSEIFLKEQAMLSMARIYRLEKKPEKSDVILKEFVEKFPTSPFLPQAKAYLRSSYKQADPEH